MPNVSVIIPTYNLDKYIKEAIDSVLAQTYKDYEIIVVDDGSSDNTKDILAPYIQKNLIRYYYQNNRGIAGARNTGIRLSKGQLIAFLDADDLWFPDKLRLQVPILGSDSRIGLVHADTAKFTESGQLIPSLRTGFSIEQIKRHSGKVFDSFFCREIFISCLTVIVKKECFDKVGFFDEEQILQGFDDSEMWLRILHFYEAYYIHKPLSLYRLRQSNFSKNSKHMSKAHEYAINKISRQFNLPEDLKKQAVIAMLKEWRLKHYRFLAHIRRANLFIKSILRHSEKEGQLLGQINAEDIKDIERWLREKYLVKF